MKSVKATSRGKATRGTIDPRLAPTGYAESFPGYQRAIFSALGFEDDEVVHVGEDSQNALYYATNLAIWNKSRLMIAQKRLTKAEADLWYDKTNVLAAEVFQVLVQEVRAARNSAPTAPILKRGLDATERLKAILAEVAADEE